MIQKYTITTVIDRVDNNLHPALVNDEIAARIIILQVAEKY